MAWRVLENGQNPNSGGTAGNFIRSTSLGNDMDRNLTILIAEDNPDYAMFLEGALRETGRTNPVHVVTDGEEAISYLEGSGKYGDRKAFGFPAVLLLDLKMPGTDGFGVLRWMHQNPDYRVVPTMVLSSSVLDIDVKLAYVLGANAYVENPGDLNELKAMLDDACKFWAWCTRPETPYV
jgi:CheY-like chemotaxis protein